MAESKIDDGGLAFPLFEEGPHTSVGMSLRDYFAGQAMASIPLRAWDHVGKTDLERIEAWAKCSYLIADAMIAVRKGGEA